MTKWEVRNPTYSYFEVKNVYIDPMLTNSME